MLLTLASCANHALQTAHNLMSSGAAALHHAPSALGEVIEDGEAPVYAAHRRPMHGAYMPHMAVLVPLNSIW